MSGWGCHDGEYIQNAGEAIIQAFIWAFFGYLPGAAGGLYLSRAFLKKIDCITQSTRAIMR